ncbi:MAG TPA: AI-2E family transporter [Armatimonadota bacterium]|jgi:predicted PurR-regulated permease PerM
MVVSEHAEQGSQSAGIPSAFWWKKLILALLIVAAIIVGYFIFQEFLRVTMTILVLAVMLAYLLQPAVEWLVRISRWKHPHAARITATLVVYLALAVALFFVGAGVIRAVSGNYQDLKITWKAYAEKKNFPEQLAALQVWYENTIPEDIRTQVATGVQNEVGHLSEKGVSGVLAPLIGIVKKTGQWIALTIELIFVPLVAFYFLTDARNLREQLLFFIPIRHRESTLRYGQAMDRILRRYVQSQLILCAIAWAVVTIGLILMGIKGAILLGIIAGISRAIPILGPLIGGIPVLGSVLLSPWSGAIWWVVIGFTALHFFESKFLMPRILGDHLGVHPVIVIISLLVGYQLLGLLGMFLAPPAIAMVQFVLALRRGEQPFGDAPATSLSENTPSVS